LVKQELTTATKNAAFKFAHASQQALVLKKGNHLYKIDQMIQLVGSTMK